MRHTKIAAEVIHDTFTTPTSNVGATTWFVQATQTLTPRWFVAGRHEGTASPVLGSGQPFAPQPHMLANELTAGVRINHDVTIKASYYVRQPYGRVDWDQQGAVQAVWQHRWW